MELCSGQTDTQTDRHTDITNIVVTLAGAREPIMHRAWQVLSSENVAINEIRWVRDILTLNGYDKRMLPRFG